MKQHIVEGDYCISYPVGLFITKNIEPIQKMANAILLNKENYESLQIVCMGSSGAIIAALITTFLKNEYINISIIHIKKDGESSHDNNMAIDTREHNQLIIVDDIMSTGLTLNRILDKISTINYISERSIEIYISGDLLINRINRHFYRYIKLVSAREFPNFRSFVNHPTVV